MSVTNSKDNPEALVMRVNRLAFASLLLLALTACTYGRDPWRLQKKGEVWTPQNPPATPFNLEDPKNPPAELAKQSWEHFDTFDVGIVEYDDKGKLWSPEQKRLVLDEINAAILAKGAATIVVYAHGWHHNARVDDENIVSFRNVLGTIAAQQHVGMTCSDPNPDKNRVIGVYIGWRGESSTNPVLTWLTIWDRKRSAHVIGGPSTGLEKTVKAVKKDVEALKKRIVGEKPQSEQEAEQESLPDLLLKLDEIRTTANNTVHATNQRFTSLTIVGHSLGGAMLLSAMQQIVFGDTKPHFTSAARPLQKNVGDLVVLINPAVEARRYGFFETVVAPGATFDPAQAPVLVTISSKGDWPNKWPFWIARFITTLHSPQRWFEPVRSTVNLGFRSAWKTHELAMSEDVAKEIDETKSFVLTDRDYYPNEATPDKSPLNLAGNAKFFHGTVSLTTRNDLNLSPNAPFLIVQGTTKIIQGHNDIFSNRLLTFLLPYATATERKRVKAFCENHHIGPAAAMTASTK
jgi:hypothetical protein